jgi:NCS2 family nucleobase:cation symporter-2
VLIGRCDGIDNFFRIMSAELKPIFGDPVIMTSVVAVVFNAYFKRTSRDQATARSLMAARAAGHI